MASTNYEPVKLARGEARRTARSAAEETELRFAGWHSERQVDRSASKAEAPAEASTSAASTAETNRPATKKS